MAGHLGAGIARGARINMSNNSESELWKLVRALQSSGTGQGCKAVSVTLFFDGRGTLIGRGEIQKRRLYPDNLFEKLAQLTEGNASDNIMQ